MPAKVALEELQKGNQRFVLGLSREASVDVRAARRAALASKGQSPMAAVFGCADSRAPVEAIFDAKPGDIFVLRNAGNTCTHAEGSIVGSLDFAVQQLHTRLIVVMGHTRCGAITGATHAMQKLMEAGCKFEVGPRERTHEHAHLRGHWRWNARRLEPSTELESLLFDLAPAAAEAAAELPENAGVEAIAARTVHVNVVRTIDSILSHSTDLREKVRQGDVMVVGAVYDIESGNVDFLGESPNQEAILR